MGGWGNRQRSAENRRVCLCTCAAGILWVSWWVGVNTQLVNASLYSVRQGASALASQPITAGVWGWLEACAELWHDGVAARKHTCLEHEDISHQPYFISQSETQEWATMQMSGDLSSLVLFIFMTMKNLLRVRRCQPESLLLLLSCCKVSVCVSLSFCTGTTMEVEQACRVGVFLFLP